MAYTPHERSQTHISVKLKFWFFKHYWWLLCIVIVSTFVILIVLKEPITTIATVIGALLSLVYFLQKQKLEELRLFRELFKEFNARYDELNERLASILESKEVEISVQEKETLIDYFNLCGEEYLYYTKGYIDPSVWEAWFNGMKIIFSNPKVQCVWSAEKKTGSYYGLPL